MDKISSAVLSLKAVEAKFRDLVNEIEKDVEGIQLLVIIAVPDKEHRDTFACSGYLNMDSPLVIHALQRELGKPIDKNMELA